MVKSKIVFLIIILFVFTNSLIFINALPTYFDWRDNNGDFLESSFDAIKFSFNSADENFADLRVGGNC